MTSEMVWYGRMLVWIGAVVLLAEALLGRSSGISTLVGVLMLSAGFVAFLGGLIAEGRPAPSTAPAEQPEVSSTALNPVPEQVPARPTPKPKPRSEPVVEAPAVEPVSTSHRIVTFEASGADAAPCTRCQETVATGQVAARCPVCGSLHHATCWIENHFHCAAPDCSGHGSLEAPDED